LLHVSLNPVRDFPKSAAKRSSELASVDATERTLGIGIVGAAKGQFSTLRYYLMF
jgi:hypothetical protein